MSINNIQCIKQISSFINTPINKLNLNGEKIPTCTIKNKSITGFVNIILTLLQEIHHNLLGSDVLERAEIRQWLEYCVTYASQHSNSQSAQQILQELNNILSTRSYLVNNNLSIADIALFYTVQDLIARCSHLDKEKHLNVSRWFDNVQQNENVRKNTPLIDFSTVFLCMR